MYKNLSQRATFLLILIVFVMPLNNAESNECLQIFCSRRKIQYIAFLLVHDCTAENGEIVPPRSFVLMASKQKRKDFYSK